MKRAAIPGLLLALPLLANAATTRTLTGEIPASSVNLLAITVGVGELRITPSADDTVHVRVMLQPKARQFLWFFHWQSTATAKEIRAAQLSEQRNGAQLSLSLGPAGKLNNSGVKQTWDVQMPARLALDISMKVGQITVTGIAGGVQTNLDVGEIDLDTPRGPLSAEVNVGQISAASATAAPGSIDLSSDIGEAALFMNGKAVRSGGRHSGLGRRIHLDGSGSDSMHLSVNVGEVDLRINSPRSSKTKA